MEEEKKESRGCCFWFFGSKENSKEKEEMNAVDAVDEKGEVIVHTSEEENEDEEVGELDFTEKIKNKKSKTSVSAEAYGNFNKKQAFVAPVIQKTNDQIKKIKDRLANSFMFSSLNEKDMMTVIMAMKEMKINAEEYVIKQGDDGDYLYVLDQGECDCYKTFEKDKGDVLLKTYVPGDAFGELALLYNAPRAASIKTKNECVFFALDRETFSHIVKEAAGKKREQYKSFLTGFEVFERLSDYEKTTIADSLQNEKFKEGDTIFKQGDEGEKFYLIEEGSVKVLTDDKVVNELKSGSYFGELALLYNQPRKASVIATSDLTLAFMNKRSFQKLLGSASEIMKRKAEDYNLKK